MEMTSMPMLCKTFPTEVAARRAVAALRATGRPGRDLRLLTGRPLGDIPQEPSVSTPDRSGAMPQSEPSAAAWFGAARAPSPSPAIPTSSAKVVRGRRPRRDRQLHRRGAHARHRPPRVRRLLGRAALGGDALARAVNELHRGRAVVLVDLREIAAGDPRDQREQLARAA
jgi:hypothetical protein